MRRVIKSTENTSWCSLSKIDFEKLSTFGHEYINELQRNIDNPFSGCILVNWQEFCNNVKIETTREILDTLVGCFGFNGPLRQYFSLYQAVSQREGGREEKG